MANAMLIIKFNVLCLRRDLLPFVLVRVREVSSETKRDVEVRVISSKDRKEVIVTLE